jgi:hypothetical protein
MTVELLDLGSDVGLDRHRELLRRHENDLAVVETKRSAFGWPPDHLPATAVRTLIATLAIRLIEPGNAEYSDLGYWPPTTHDLEDVAVIGDLEWSPHPNAQVLARLLNRLRTASPLTHDEARRIVTQTGLPDVRAMHLGMCSAAASAELAQSRRVLIASQIASASAGTRAQLLRELTELEAVA